MPRDPISPPIFLFRQITGVYNGDISTTRLLSARRVGLNIEANKRRICRCFDRNSTLLLTSAINVMLLALEIDQKF